MPSHLRHRIVSALIALPLLAAACAPAFAQSGPHPVETKAGQSASDLAKASQNPVGDLTAIPFQFNWNTGGAYGDRTFYNLNFQPVFPLRVSSGINLIARPIVPYLNIPSPGGSPGAEARATGIGDIQLQLYFTPTKSSSLTWGVGPVASLPTATNDLARSGDWAVGPGIVLLTMPGPWVIGGLANQVWTVGSNDVGDEDVEMFTMQPFINFNLARGWALSVAPVITKNGAITSGEQWTVPVGGGVTKVAAIGKQPVSLGLQYFHNAVRPEGSAEEQIRMIASFLFPVAK